MSNPWAVVTGASSGLGVAYARRLASEGVNVVLVARTESKLRQVAEALTGVETRVIAADLTDPADRLRVGEACADLDVSHLINNAGFGTIGEFASIEPERVSQEMALNMVAVTELARRLIPGMVARGSGAVVNVASTAAFQPIPTMAVYAATKAYVVRLSVALWQELHSTGVRVLAICPGPTETEFFANAGNADVMRSRRTPEQVVDTTWAALKAHQPVVVDGARNKAMAFATRFAPVSLQARLAREVANH